jgi:hypothetical protein
MFKIVYDPEHGQIVPDADVESFVESYIVNHSRNAKVTVGSELLILAFRAEIAEGNLDPSNVEFWYNGKQVQHLKNGDLVNPQPGFCDLQTRLVHRLLKFRRANLTLLNTQEDIAQ